MNLRVAISSNPLARIYDIQRMNHHVVLEHPCRFRFHVLMKFVERENEWNESPPPPEFNRAGNESRQDPVSLGLGR